jgi:hypothetical protein
MTIFELGFFYFRVSNDEAEIIRSKLSNAKDLLNQLVANKSASYGVDLSKYIINNDNVANNFLEVEKIRELLLNDKINNDAIIFICIEMMLFVIGIIVLFSKLKDKKSCLPSLAYALITVAILIIFQILMYNYGGGMGTEGSFMYFSDPELMYQILNKLKTDLK